MGIAILKIELFRFEFASSKEKSDFNTCWFFSQKNKKIFREVKIGFYGHYYKLSSYLTKLTLDLFNHDIACGLYFFLIINLKIFD